MLISSSYIPIWFQAIKGTTATQSGINNLAMILAQVIGVLVSGGLTTALGYYNPFMLASPVFMSIGAGLMTLFALDTPTGKWIGYQILFGIGTGIGFQQPLIAAQTTLPEPDIPTGTALITFVQILGGALFVSVGQNVFANKLVAGLAGIPGIDVGALLGTGATQLKGLIPDPALAERVLVAYNYAIIQVFQVALIMSALAIFGAVAMEWKSVKGKKVATAA